MDDTARLWVIGGLLFVLVWGLWAGCRGLAKWSTAERAPRTRKPTDADKLAARRRADVRAGCELMYSMNAVELAARFPREVFDRFVSQYMGDADEPEAVEARGRQLQEVLRQHLQKKDAPEPADTLPGLATWYRKQRAQIEALPNDPLRDTLLAQLQQRYAELTTKMIEETQP